MATLPMHKALMRCFSFFDLVGFQTETDRGHLLDYLVREAGARVEEREGGATVRAFRRVFKVETHAIGIDTRYVERNATKAESSREYERLRMGNYINECRTNPFPRR